jgi:hypothetical protein
VISGITDEQIIADPLVMGFTTFDHPLNKDLGLDLIVFTITKIEVRTRRDGPRD